MESNIKQHLRLHRSLAGEWSVTINKSMITTDHIFDEAYDMACALLRLPAVKVSTEEKYLRFLKQTEIKTEIKTEKSAPNTIHKVHQQIAKAA